MSTRIKNIHKSMVKELDELSARHKALLAECESTKSKMDAMQLSIHSFKQGYSDIFQGEDKKFNVGGLSGCDVARMFIRSNGLASLKQIQEFLQERNIKLTHQTLYALLRREKRIEKLSPGLWKWIGEREDD